MELREAVPSMGSLGGGLLFGVGWLLWIDGVCGQYADYGQSVNGALWIPGILQTIALFMVNVINWGLLTDDPFDDSVSSRVKCWVFSSFMLAFSGLFGAIWVFIAAHAHESSDGLRSNTDAALRCLLQNLFVFAGSLLFRVVRTKDDSN
mmetsp:Transcript_1955/g.4190  ORF Transcript_1955/g.4190 Transcript_1955/m.4190 type:complete len:149 (-) Transcript_1955:254-700(-)